MIPSPASGFPGQDHDAVVSRFVSQPVDCQSAGPRLISLRSVVTSTQAHEWKSPPGHHLVIAGLFRVRGGMRPDGS